MRRVSLFFLGLLSVAGAPLHAQQAVSPQLQVSVNPDLWTASTGSAARAISSAPLPSPQIRAASPVTLAAVGVLAAAASFIGGIYLGGTIENEFAPCGCDDPGLRGALLGAALVPQIVIPVAVHWADDENGSFLRTLGGSLIGGAAVAAVAAASRSLEIAVFGAP